MGQGLSKRRTVLIVEDDLDLRRLTTTLLEDEQLETIECESAEAALAIMLMRGRDIAMIFADVRLPGAMDGIDLAWEVRLRWPLLPMVLTSGHPCERAGDLPLAARICRKHEGGFRENVDYSDATPRPGAFAIVPQCSSRKAPPQPPPVRPNKSRVIVPAMASVPAIYRSTSGWLPQG